MIRILEKKTNSPQETKEFAQGFCRDWLKKEKNFTLFFQGALGAGKTLCIQSILHEYGILKEITSPTYIFVNEYETKKNRFAHFDFYRLPEPSEFFARGFHEIAENPDIIKLVEWPEKITMKQWKLFSLPHFEIQIEQGTNDERLISVFKNS